MSTRPSRVWVLAEGFDAPVLVPGEDLNSIFAKYEDTGFELKLEWLYKTIGCRCVDLREIPGLGRLWFDDEGRLAGRSMNPVASALYEHCYRTGEGIIGTAVLVIDSSTPVERGAIVEMVHNQITEARKGMN